MVVDEIKEMLRKREALALEILRLTNEKRALEYDLKQWFIKAGHTDLLDVDWSRVNRARRS